MHDMVKRLRGMYVQRHPSRSIVQADETTILEAADEIERLRAALKDSQKKFATLKAAYDAERRKPVVLHGSAALTAQPVAPGGDA